MKLGRGRFFESRLSKMSFDPEFRRLESCSNDLRKPKAEPFLNELSDSGITFCLMFARYLIGIVAKFLAWN